MANLVSMDIHAPLLHFISFTSLYKYIVWEISHLSWWGLMLLCAYGAGSLFLRNCNFHSRIERAVFTITLGMGLWGLALFAVGLCGALYRPLILGLTIASALATAIYLIREARGRLSLLPLSWRERLGARRWPIYAVTALALAYAGLLLLAAQYPPLHWDAAAGHLPLAQKYLTEHRVVPWRGGTFPLLPALNHMLFSWAMALKDDILAQMVEYTFLTLTALGLFSWGQRLQHPGLGFAAAALWLSHPLVLWLGESAYVDVGMTCFAFLGVYAIRVFWDKQESAWWLLSSALFGMAAGTKMPALFFVPAGAAFGFWMRIRSRITWGELAKGWAIVLLIAIPWYGFIGYHTGNPVWPMFPKYTQGAWVGSTEQAFDDLVTGGRLPKTTLNYFSLPYYLGLWPNLFFPDNNRDFTPVIALLPLAWIIAIWHRSVRWWSLWIMAYTAYWFKFAAFMRYWLPVLPLVGLALCEGLAWVMGRLSKSSVVQNSVWGVIAVLAMGYGYQAVKKDLTIKGRFPVTAEGRREFLIRLNPGYRGVDYINRHAEPGDTVAVVDGFYLIHYLKPAVTRLMKGFLERDRQTLSWSWSKKISGWGNWLAEDNVTWILLRHEGVTGPEQNPFDRPGGALYELVHTSGSAYVWRRAPLPPGLVPDIAGLEQPEPCAPTDAQAGGASPAYNGYLDITNCKIIQGWAWDANHPDCSVNVNIYDGDTLLATVPANLLRDDLAQAGIGDGKHAFKYPIPSSVRKRLEDKRPHTIRVVIAGSDVTLNNSPRTLYCE